MLTDIQPEPSHDQKLATERWSLLTRAASELGLGGRHPHWPKVEIDPADLPRLRETVERVGQGYEQRRIYGSYRFADASGQQWRWLPRYRANVRRTLLARIDRLIEAQGATP
jgi:hypothetical protein